MVSYVKLVAQRFLYGVQEYFLISILEKSPEVSAQWHPTKNGTITPEQVSYGNHKNFWWKCSKGTDHEWEASPNRRICSNAGCSICAGKKVVASNSLATLRPEVAALWHSTMNAELTPQEVTTSSRKEVWWKCPVAADHEWENSIANMTRTTENNNGCPYCHGTRVCRSNCLATLHPNIAKQWHPTINGDLTAFDVVPGSKRKVWWKCPVADDHEWPATVGNRVGRNSGCPCCTGRRAVPSNCLATTHPELANQWHTTLNGDLTPKDIVAGRNSKVWWKCPVADDHEWDATPNDRTNKDAGCPCCSNDKVVPSNCLATTHPDLANEWHTEKNRLTPQEVTYGSNLSIWWHCRYNSEHDWQADICNRAICKSDCPVCSVSKGEEAVADTLTKLEINFSREYRFDDCRSKRALPFDFAVLNKRDRVMGVIEFHGEQHYEIVPHFDGKRGLKQRQQRDKIKEEYCNTQQIPMLVIPHTQFDLVAELIAAFVESLRPSN